MIDLAPIRRAARVAPIGLCALAATVAAQVPAPKPTLKPEASRLADVVRPAASDPVDMDARRAAAARLLAASRFRDRQAVTIDEGIHAAELEMADECLQRAIDGANMRTCKAVAQPSPAFRARLAASESMILDEIVAASQSIFARRFTVADMDEITRFFKTPVGQRYGDVYPQLITDTQARKRTILRRYLTRAATADQKAL